MPYFKLNDVFADRYQLTELMGEGDFSEVWKARDQSEGDALIVLKIYAPAKELDDEEVRQIRREFSLSKNLSHPHLLKAYHFGVSEANTYMVMPYCPMGSLKRLLEEQGPLSERQLALVLSQIGSALEELHSQDPPALHQDVKPENILISQPDHFLLADLGISSPTKQTLAKSATVPKATTLAYAPPENFDPGQTSTAAGDIFSLGVTLFEMCTKTLPWGGSGGQILLKGENVPALPKHYSAELNELLMACMSVNSAKRPRAGELQRRGNHFLETGNWNLPGQEKKEAKSYKRMKPQLLAAAIVLLLLIGAFGAYYYKDLANPIERLQKRASSGNQESGGREEDINEMLITTLEDQLEELTQHARELEEENRRLKGNSSGNNILMRNEDQVFNDKQKIEKPQKTKKGQGIEEPQIEEGKTQILKETPPVQQNKVRETNPGTPPKKENNALLLSKKLEKQLNKVSDPSISDKDREAWKEETMAHFSKDAIRIVDETVGEPKQYAASIFLNLLSKVPHTIVVKEVKTDQNNKVTELRLSMETKM